MEREGGVEGEVAVGEYGGGLRVVMGGSRELNEKREKDWVDLSR